MRRIIIPGAAAAVLAGAAVAYAASAGFNSYTATLAFSPAAAGSKARPSAFSMHELWTAHGNGQDTAPLTKIVTKIYGVVTNGRDFPKCTAKMITANPTKWNRSCPKGSLIAQGPVQSLLVPASNPHSPGTPCDPYLYVYNGGQGVQVFFFVSGPFSPNPVRYTCDGTMTGTSAPPYNGYITERGGYEVVTIPLPKYVSTEAGNITGAYASLQRLDVVYAKLTRKVHGRMVAYQASVACMKGRRPYSTTFTAQNYPGESPSTQTTTIKGNAKC